MYGDLSSTTFNELHRNLNSSNIKNAVDYWYNVNINNKNFGSYISDDVGFCGDRTLYSGDGISTTAYSYFGSYGRFVKKTAQFTCPEPFRDLYTTPDSSIGNKVLTYPVGLITYDELVFSGQIQGTPNKLGFVYSENSYWTMSPSVYDGKNNYAVEWMYGSYGHLNPWAWHVIIMLGTRPVINLKVDVEISGGIGTVNEPFIIETK